MKTKKIVSNSKRNIPQQDILLWRENYLSKIPNIEFSSKFLDAPLLELGNSKIGQNSHIYQMVYVWNLPAVLTCPSASKWCLRCCYNADERTEKFPIDRWQKNLQYFLNLELELETKLTDKLIDGNKKVAVRIHSSGDFFSIKYIEFWIRIIRNTPNVQYWAYTRSWSEHTLFDKLLELKALSNIELFASWDETMPQPPSGWRKSLVGESISYSSKGGILCPEQIGKKPNCATCNYCMSANNGDVYFILH